MLSIVLRPAIDIRNALLNVESLRSRKRGDTWIRVVLVVNLLYFGIHVYLRHTLSHHFQQPSAQEHVQYPLVDNAPKTPVLRDPFNSGPLGQYKASSLKRLFQRPAPVAVLPNPVLVTLLGQSTLPAVERFIASAHKWHPDWRLWIGAEPGVALSTRLTSRHNVEGASAHELLQHVCTHSDLASAATPGSRLARLRLHPACTQNASDALLPDDLVPLSWAPLALHLALQKHAHAIYVDSSMEISGWNDAAFKHVLRDGALFVRDHSANACSSAVWGFARGSSLVLQILEPYMRCMFQEGCVVSGPVDTWLTQILDQTKLALPCRPFQLLKMTRQQQFKATRDLAVRDEDEQDFVHLSLLKESEEKDEHGNPYQPDEGDARDNMTCYILSGPRLQIDVMLRLPASNGWHPHDTHADKASQRTSLLGREASPGPSPLNTSSRPACIAIAIPILAPISQTVSGLDVFLGTFLPSLVNSVATLSEGVRYAVYVVYEQGNTDMDRLEKATREAKQAVGPAPVAITISRVPETGSATAAWNAAARSAFDDGVDYLMLAHADTRLPPSWQSVTPGGLTTWADTLLQALHGSTMGNDFGVAMPLDARAAEGMVVTHALVHRQHMAIFGEMLPWQLRGPAALAWLSRVYGPYCTFVVESVSGFNNVDAQGVFSGSDLAAAMRGASSMAGGAKAGGCDLDSTEVDTSVTLARDTLMEWVVRSLGVAADMADAFL